MYDHKSCSIFPTPTLKLLTSCTGTIAPSTMKASPSTTLQTAESAGSNLTHTNVASPPSKVVLPYKINPIPTLVSVLAAAGIIICCLVIVEALIAAIICYKMKKRQSRRIHTALHDEEYIATITTAEIHEIPTDNGGTLESVKESTNNRYSLKRVTDKKKKKSQLHNFSPTKNYGSKYISPTSVAHDIPTEYLHSVGTAKEIIQNSDPGLGFLEDTSTEEDLSTQLDKLADGLVMRREAWI